MQTKHITRNISTEFRLIIVYHRPIDGRLIHQLGILWMVFCRPFLCRGQTRLLMSEQIGRMKGENARNCVK